MAFFTSETDNRKKSGKNQSSFFTTPQEESSLDIGKVNTQIDNAKMRIQDAGYSISDADKRNWFEKMTNLPEGQNAFFDALELLGRPGAAVVNAVNTGIKGGDSIDAAWKGFSGQERTRGADLAETLGVENKYLKAGLGTLLDIGLDPTTYIPGAVFAKGAKLIGSGAKSVGRGAVNAAERIAPEFTQDKLRSAIEGTKDAFGRMFIPDYKLDETLYGQTDDTIKKLKQQTENRIRFQSEESMKNVADAAKLAGGTDKGIDVGRIMEKDVPLYGPRQSRELSPDPNIQQAAQNLMNSNTELRQWAIDNDIPVGEIESYMKHIWSREERKRKNNLRTLPLDRGNFGSGQPNKNVLKSRELQGSAEDINDQIGRTFFEPNAFFATAIGQKQLIEYANAVNFRRQVLSNQNFAQKYEKGMPRPKNAVVIDTNNYKFLKDPDGAGDLANEIGGQYLVTKSVKQALDRYQRLTTDEGVNSFLKILDTAQSSWKRLALFSVPYHLRNDIGAKFNNWVGGMSLKDLGKYTFQADKEVYNAIIKAQETPMYREFREQGLGSSGLSAIEYAKRGQEPEDAILKTIEKRSKFDGTLGGRVKAEVKSLKNPLNAFETSRDFGDFVDQTNRYALYKWARSKGMSPEQAAAKVREVQFDYSKTTPFESNVLTRALPFYRWMRNNIPFQLRQFINDPRKYANINKLRLNAQDAVGLDEENVPDWMKDAFALPVTGGEGKGSYLGLGLPLSDLTKLNKPGKTLLDAVSPLAKLPAELTLNRNFYFNKPIKKFEGEEKKYQVPFGGPEFGIDSTIDYIVNQLAGPTGRALAGYLKNPDSEDKDILNRIPSLGISSMFKKFNANDSEYYQQLEKLRALQDLIKYIEQQEGQKPRTVSEINREGSSFFR